MEEEYDDINGNPVREVVMRKISLFLIVMILLSCVNIYAADHSTSAGEVLYHQDFSEISNIAYSGIIVGTQSTESAFIDCPRDDLSIRIYNKGRVYLILPQIERSAGYTVEFEFSFEDHESNNGYIAFMLNCRGEEPTNISSVVIRQSGSVTDFAEPDTALAEAIASGKTVHVTIPIENNVLHKIILTVDEVVYTLERDTVLVIPSEGFGFEARNTNVNVSEVFVVDGVDYSEKSGYYAENSFATDENPVISDGNDTAPDTSDDMPVIVWIVGGSAVVLLLVVLLGKKRK